MVEESKPFRSNISDIEGVYVCFSYEKLEFIPKETFNRVFGLKDRSITIDFEFTSGDGISKGGGWKWETLLSIQKELIMYLLIIQT